MKSVVAAVALMSGSFALASSSAIGTVSTRGQVRVDGYTVRGTATLFDNTAVETNDFAATLRLNKGTEIKLGVGSSGTLFSDRLVLSRGETELTTSDRFQLEANGLHISSSAPNAKAMVMVSPQNTLLVAALSGELSVMNNRGLLLARVNPGSSMSFSPVPAADGAPNTPSFSDVGLLSYENGHYYLLSTLSGSKYEVTGKRLNKYVGDKVQITGKLNSGSASAPGSVTVSSIELNLAGGGMGAWGPVLLGTAGAAGAAAIGYAIANPASR